MRSARGRSAAHLRRALLVLMLPGALGIASAAVVFVVVSLLTRPTDPGVAREWDLRLADSKLSR